MPHPRTQFFILVLLIITALLGYNYFAQPFASKEMPAPEKPLPPATVEEPENQAQVVFDQLTTEEKVAQLLAVPLLIENETAVQDEAARQSTQSALIATNSTQATSSSQQEQTASPESDVTFSDWVELNNPGFLLIFGEEVNKSRATEVVTIYRGLSSAKAKKLMPAAVVDHEGGGVQRLSGIGYTTLPSWREFCNLDDIEQAELLAESSAELAETGINLILAPMLDLAQNNPILSQRTCGNDSGLVAASAAKFSRAFLSENITPVFKHFPGIGSVNRDLHFSFAQTEVSNESSILYRDMMADFPSAGILVTHAGVINSNDPNTPCSTSPGCVGALREMFPEVISFTDSLTMQSVYYTATSSAQPTLADVSLRAVQAGNTVLTYDQSVSPKDMDLIIAKIVEEYESSEDFASLVDKNVQRIISYKEQHNLLRKE